MTAIDAHAVAKDLGVSVEVVEFAIRGHKDQFRRDGVTPYVTHPIRVAGRVKNLGGSEEAVTVALFHDILEDSSDSDIINHMFFLFGRRVYEYCEMLNKKNFSDYDAMLQSIKSQDITRLVKVADCIDNLSDNPTEKQIKKYTKALDFLTR